MKHYALLSAVFVGCLTGCAGAPPTQERLSILSDQELCRGYSIVRSNNLQPNIAAYKEQLLKREVVCSGSTASRAPSGPPVTWTRTTATSTEIALAKKIVKDGLKDPYSVQFEEFWALKGTNGNRAICGYANAKNSYGAYTGKKMFSILGDSVVFENTKYTGQMLPGICMPRTVQP